MKNKFAYTGLVFLMMACGGGDEAETEDNGTSAEGTEVENIEINDEGGSVTIEDNEGNSVTYGAGEGVPEGFPLDVAPIYKGGKVYTTVNSSSSNHENGYVLSYGTDESAETIGKFYRDFYDKSEIIQEMKLEGADMITATKGDHTISIVISSKEEPDEYGKTGVSLTVINE